MALLEAVEINENARRGDAIPAPKNTKRKILPTKSMVEVDIVLVKRTAIKSGLQGNTIAPKKKPKRNALIIGFLTTGALVFGRNFPKSILNISNKLIIINMPKAMGEIISITAVRETFNIVVKISPNNSMNEITPNDTSNPNSAIVFLSCSFPDS
ncbi:MAG: hypothetical protein KAH86_01600 [Methanosarcinales archaeon]|nr:hypothetical protein [Methanosarcinales archaeon]